MHDSGAVRRNVQSLGYILLITCLVILDMVLFIKYSSRKAIDKKNTKNNQEQTREDRPCDVTL